MKLGDEPCQYLEWDTEFFKHRIARVNFDHLDEPAIQEINRWSTANRIECLYFLAHTDDPQSIWVAENNGFRLVEVRMTYHRSLKDWNPEARQKVSLNVTVRSVKPEDIPMLQSIASTSYVDSRFYFDTRFSKEKWMAYYATWLKNSCTGGADLVIVAEKDGEPVGYITGLVTKGKVNEGQYELTGVMDSARKAGVGQELFCSGLDWYVRHGIDYVWVITAGRNIPTNRMIQRNGFTTRSCQLYYHKWF